MQAYRQAAANSAAAGTQAGKAAATTGISGSNLLTKQLGIDLDEACKILNVKKEGLVLEEINKVRRVTHLSGCPEVPFSWFPSSFFGDSLSPLLFYRS
jgi:hypothetical protein